MDTPKPIGYWLMHLHNLIEEQFERTLSGLSVSRRQWQLLNTLSRGSRTSGELAEALAPFWSGAAEDPQAVLADLADRGWTRVDGDAIGLSETGRELHAELAARVERARAALLGDLTPEQYHQTVRSLATMAANVEAALGNPARTASSVS
ncbi:MarR family winged helix-turn-helix transcriptional regulator [Hamadaea sp. NPDC051192]|uniref:MarR family winged helix-turn-helix transcriptional regulator n=1 Tax=Hamadaea sp. NPDC051192 TaxID=3154940 RepID=UPI00344A2075